MQNRTLAALVFALVATAGTARAGTVLQCYTEIPSTMISTVTSQSGYSGQVFRFRTTASVTTNGASVPAGTLGWGIVLSAVPASNHARNGIVVLEPRFLMLQGSQFAVAGDPRDASILTHGVNPVAAGSGAVPLPGFGLAVSEAIKGTNITIGPGYNFHVVPIGNLQRRGPCLQVPATPSPAPKH